MIQIFILVLLFLAKVESLSIHESLFGVSLTGEWKITNNKKDIMGVIRYETNSNNQFKPNPNKIEEKDMSLYESFFNVTQGISNVMITQAMENSKKPHFYLQLMDSKYISNRVIELSFVLAKGYNHTLDQWKSPKFLTSAKLFENFNQLVTFDLKMNFQMKRNTKGQVHIALISDSINVDLYLQPASYSISYFVGFALINLVQFILLVYFGGSTTILANTSEWLLLQSCFFLIFQSILMLKIALGYYDTKLSLILINSIANVAVMMLILWKFTAVVEKFKNKLNFLLALIFTAFYFSLLYFNYTSGFIWIIQCMLFLWQIAYSTRRGGAGGVSIELVLVILLSRVPLLLIMKSDENLFKIKSQPLAFNFIVACMCFHLIVIWCQKKFGARFFTPVMLIPNYFNYLREDTFDSDVAATDCSICLNRLRESPNSASKTEEESEKEVQERKNEKIKYVYTKCKHYYHQKCLHDWLRVHLVCPLCKSDLPPMDLGA